MFNVESSDRFPEKSVWIHMLLFKELFNITNYLTKYLLHICLTWKVRSFKECAFQYVPCWVVYVFLGLNLRPVRGLPSCWELSFWTAIIQAHQQLLTVCSLSSESVLGPFCWFYFLKVIGHSEATVAREEWACLSILTFSLCSLPERPKRSSLCIPMDAFLSILAFDKVTVEIADFAPF